MELHLVVWDILREAKVSPRYDPNSQGHPNWYFESCYTITVIVTILCSKDFTMREMGSLQVVFNVIEFCNGWILRNLIEIMTYPPEGTFYYLRRLFFYWLFTILYLKTKKKIEKWIQVWNWGEGPLAAIFQDGIFYLFFHQSHIQTTIITVT